MTNINPFAAIFASNEPIALATTESPNDSSTAAVAAVPALAVFPERALIPFALAAASRRKATSTAWVWASLNHQYKSVKSILGVRMMIFRYSVCVRTVREYQAVQNLANNV